MNHEIYHFKVEKLHEVALICPIINAKLKKFVIKWQIPTDEGLKPENAYMPHDELMAKIVGKFVSFGLADQLIDEYDHPLGAPLFN